MIDLNEFIETTKDDINGFIVIRIKKGEFEGVEFTYGAVAVNEVIGTATLSFEYNVIKGSNMVEANEEAFTDVAGDILMEMVTRQIAEGSVVYYGGIDADIRET